MDPGLDSALAQMFTQRISSFRLDDEQVADVGGGIGTLLQHQVAHAVELGGVRICVSRPRLVPARQVRALDTQEGRLQAVELRVDPFHDVLYFVRSP